MQRSVDDQGTDCKGGGIVNQHTKRAPRHRILAGVLSLFYVALMTLAFYLEAIGRQTAHRGGIDWWPSWALWVAAATWGATMLVLPFLVVKYFFGLDLSPLWRFSLRDWRFSLRAMLLCVPVISVLIWMFTQIHWIKQRQAWRCSNRAAASSALGQAPGLLRLLGEPGASRIEIKNGTKEQIAEAKRLFPEAMVVASGEVADGTLAVPVVAPVEPQPAARK